MGKRVGLSKTVRFEVFKRDSFTCQYCGAKAPEILLQVDHIIAVASKGTNAITNLITSCFACNSGKGARALSDDSALQKQRRQLEELNEHRLQLEMMAKWRKGLDELESKQVDMVAQQVADKFLYQDTILSDYGRLQVSKWIAKFSLDEIFNAIDISTNQYLTFTDGRPNRESQWKAFQYIPRICGSIRARVDKPYMKDVFYIRGILRNRLMYLNESKVIEDLDYAFHIVNVNPEYIKSLAKKIRSWTQFQNELWETISEVEANNKADDEPKPAASD